ncbi:MAG: hypothetical protein QOH47_806 [Sphingomonadales bacterium]|jgi:hypothetical protein|nr:hypothetical protein [Sphingomonadales bacterium]
MSVIGALRVVMGIDTAAYESGLRRAQTRTVAANRGIVASFTQMKTVVAGIAGGLVAGFFIQQAREAFQFAAGLSETSRSIGVTVEQLQILRRAAIENGASVEGMERAMSILNRTLGQARAGVPAAVQAFRALRIDPEQFTSAGQVLPRVMDSIHRLATESEQAAAAQRLMGRGAAEMIPFLVQGAEGYDRVAEAAREAGLITEEQARRADEAADKLALLAVTLRTNLASALLDCLPAIGEVVKGLGTLIRTAASALLWLSRVGRAGPHPETETTRVGRVLERSSDSPVAIVNPYVALVWNILREFGSDAPNPSPPGSVDIPITDLPDTGNQDLDLSPHGHHGGANRAEAARKKALRDQHEFESELRRFRMDQLREQQQQTNDTVVRGDLQQSILDIENQQYAADVALKLALDDLDEPRARQLLAAYHALDEEERGTLALERSRTLQEEENDLSDQRYDIAAAALRSQSDAADTAAERRRAELALLDLTYRHQRAKLEEIILAERTSGHERDRAQQELNALNASRASDRAGVLRNTRGPLEEFLARLPRTAAMANEALEAIAANGLQSLTDGLVDAIMQAKSLGDVFKNVAKSIIADLLRIQIQRSIIGPLSNALSSFMGGFGRGGSPGVGSSFASGYSEGVANLPRFASGGTIRVAGMAGVDSNLLSLNHRAIARVNTGENIRIDPANDRGARAGGGDIHVHVNAHYTGNLATKEDAIALGNLIAPIAVRAVRDAQRRR